MRKASRLTALLIAAAAFGGIFGVSGGVAFAASHPSSKVTFFSTSLDYCYQQQAFTVEGAGASLYTYSKTNACIANSTREIGGSAYLKKTNGVACTTATVTYVTSTSHLRTAVYSSSACGTGQLAGGGTSYGYYQSGYKTGSIMAPYGNF